MRSSAVQTKRLVQAQNTEAPFAIYTLDIGISSDKRLLIKKKLGTLILGDIEAVQNRKSCTHLILTTFLDERIKYRMKVAKFLLVRRFTLEAQRYVGCG